MSVAKFNFKNLIFEDTILDVDSETLDRLGFKNIIAKDGISSEGLKALKEELAKCETAHSWKQLINGPLDYEKFVNFESKKRPTKIFSYYGDGKEYIGSAAVASKINNDFPSEGFPVIARAFIKKQYRNHRLYFPTLLQRIHFCESIFKGELMGIHMGSNNPRVYEMIKRKEFLGFSHVGSEILESESEIPFVRDYFKPYPRLANSIESELQKYQSEFDTTAIKTQLFESLNGKYGDRNLYLLELMQESLMLSHNISLKQISHSSYLYVQLLKNIPVLSSKSDLHHLVQPFEINSRDKKKIKKV